MNRDTLSTQPVAAAIGDREVSVVSPNKQFIQLAVQAKTPLLVSVRHLVEILAIATNQVVPVFQLAPWVMGVYNWRGNILWIVDLNHFLGFTPWYMQPGYPSKHTVVVIGADSQEQETSESGRISLGLVVNQVHDMVICPPELIQSTERLQAPAKIKSFLEGSWSGQNGKLHWILSGEKVLKAMATTDQPEQAP